MATSETLPTNSTSPNSSPRISFSSDFVDKNNLISSISTPPGVEKENGEKIRNKDFEFLSNNGNTMLSADELFFEGKLLPFWQMHHSEELKKISLKSDKGAKTKGKVENMKIEESRGNWFIDDDPSPRPPTCTVLWKELLRLRKQRPSTLSPSSSSSSSSSFVDPQCTEKEEGSKKKEKNVKRMKKGLERTRSATMRIRPVVNVPICTHAKNSALPPLFSLRKGKLEKPE